MGRLARQAGRGRLGQARQVESRPSRAGQTEGSAGGDAYSQILISYGAYDTVENWPLKKYSSVRIVSRAALKEP